MNDSKVTAAIVTNNSMKYLTEFVESLVTQDYPADRIVVVDNFSADESVSFLRANYPQIIVLQNMNDQGYARARNQSVLLSHSDFILFLSPDTILEKNALRMMINELSSHAHAAACVPKILQKSELASPAGKLSVDVLYSAGIACRQPGGFVMRGFGEDDRGQYDVPQEVFAMSGVCALVRRQAIEQIKLSEGEYWTQIFSAFFSDVDLSWRLRNAGWKILYTGSSWVYHFSANAPSLGWRKNKFPEMDDGEVYFQHLFLWLVNDFHSDFLQRVLFFVREAGKSFLFLFLNFSAVTAWYRVMTSFPVFSYARSARRGKVNFSNASIKGWFGSQ